MLLICGCSDKYNFDGVDNSLTSFSLKTTDGNVYQGSIGPDNIVKIELDNEIDLNNSKVSYSISYKATILPNPEHITDWNNEQVFNVISKDGHKKTYTVKIIRKEMTYDGNIVLKNDNDVADLANKKITEIKGDLIIGSESGEEKIENIDALTYLKKVRHAIIVNKGYKGKELSGLRNIVEAGKLVIDNDSITDITLKSLKEIRQSLSVKGQSLGKFSLPKLTTIEQDWTISANKLTNLDFPKLKKSGGFNIESKSLSIIEFKELEEITGDLRIENMSSLFKLALPKLKSVKGSLTIKQNKLLQIAKADNLESVKGDFEVSGSAISSLTLTKLQEAGSDFTITNNTSLKTLVTKQLKEIGGNLIISSLPVKNLQDLSVETAKSIELSNLSSLEDISSYIAKIKAVKEKLNLKYINIATELDLRHIQFSHEENNGNNNSEVTLDNSPKITKVLLPQNVGISITGSSDLEQEMPTIIEGGGNVQNLEYNLKVKNNARLVLNGFKKIHSLSISSNIEVIEAPVLEEAEIRINNATGFKELKTPHMKRIGYLSLNAGWNGGNHKMKNLNFLSDVDIIKKISIRNFKELNDYSGLKRAIENNSLNSSNFSISGCAYNPKYQDLLDGKFTK